MAGEDEIFTKIPPPFLSHTHTHPNLSLFLTPLSLWEAAIQYFNDKLTLIQDPDLPHLSIFESVEDKYNMALFLKQECDN